MTYIFDLVLIWHKSKTDNNKWWFEKLKTSLESYFSFTLFMLIFQETLCVILKKRYFYSIESFAIFFQPKLYNFFHNLRDIFLALQFFFFRVRKIEETYVINLYVVDVIDLKQLPNFNGEKKSLKQYLCRKFHRHLFKIFLEKNV